MVEEKKGEIQEQRRQVAPLQREWPLLAYFFFLSVLSLVFLPAWLFHSFHLNFVHRLLLLQSRNSSSLARLSCTFQRRPQRHYEFDTPGFTAFGFGFPGVPMMGFVRDTSVSRYLSLISADIPMGWWITSWYALILLLLLFPPLQPNNNLNSVRDMLLRRHQGRKVETVVIKTQEKQRWSKI